MHTQPDFKRDIPGYLGLGLLLGALGARVGGQLMGWSPQPVVLGLLLGTAALLLVVHLYLNLSRSAFVGGAQNVTLGVMFVGVVVAVYLMVQRNPRRWDFLQSFYSLSAQSKAVAKSLGEEGALVVMYPPGSNRGMVLKLARQFQQANPALVVSAVDPNDPRVRTLYKVENPSGQGQVVVRLGKKTKVVYDNELFEASPDMGMGGGGTRFSAEGAVTKAFLSLKRQRSTHLCFLSGHGQFPLEGEKAGLATVKQLLENDLYEIRAINLVREGRVPGQCNVVVEAGGQTDLSDAEKLALLDFYERGGRLLVSLLRNPHEMNNWRDLLARVGVDTVPGLLVDDLLRDQNTGESMPITLGLPLVHPAAMALKESGQNPQLPLAHGFAAKTRLPRGVTVSEVIQTTPSTWADRANDAQAPRFTAGEDKKGPFAAAIAATRPTSRKDRLSKEGRLLAVGGAVWLMDGNLNVAWPNQQLLLSAAGWLGGSDILVKARPKTLGVQAKSLSPNQLFLANVTALFLLPLALLAVAAMQWRRARAK